MDGVHQVHSSRLGLTEGCSGNKRLSIIQGMGNQLDEVRSESKLEEQRELASA